jgi:hypothetical protein
MKYAVSIQHVQLNCECTCYEHHMTGDASWAPADQATVACTQAVTINKSADSNRNHQ